MRECLSCHINGRSRPTGSLWALRFLTVAVGLCGAGCRHWPIFPPPPETGRSGLEKFASAEAFKRYLADQYDASQRWQRDGGDGPIFFFDMTPGGAVPMAAPDAAESDSFSTTNIQEAGVDESDVVKNDATYLYILSGAKSRVWYSGDSELKIVRATPADAMSIVSTLDLPGTPVSLYLAGDTVVALSTQYDPDGNGGEHGFWHGSTPVTVVTILDVSDRASPVVRATVELEGSLNTSRLIGAKLHLVLGFWPVLPKDPGPIVIQNAAYDELVPDLTVALADGRQVRRNVVDWSDCYHPIDADGYHMTSVVTLDVDRPDAEIHSVGVMADASTVYVSPEALYLTDNEFDYAGRFRETTDLYKLRLTDDGAVLAGAGSVPGRLLNRYSLGEYQGYLRAATTLGHAGRSWSATESTNHVYVLGEQDGQLTIVGRVENIAPGEQIYSARFVGPRGFLVTFKKIDPLFTLNLEDPTAPQVVGRLKVPGYSDYIHPFGENHLLTIGKDAVDMGDFAWYQGVQLSVFDVTNFSEPQRVDVEVIGDRGTQSEALYDPHAFNYFEPAEMLAIPMDIYEGAGADPSSYGYPAFTGLCLFRVTAADGIEPLARIATGAVAEPEPWLFNGSGWIRGVFLGDHVYAVTSSAVQALPLADLTAEPYHLALDQ